MTEPQIHYVSVDLRYLDERRQRELAAYRKLGSLKELRRIKHREMQRRRRRNQVHAVLDKILAGAIFGATVAGVLFLGVILS